MNEGYILIVDDQEINRDVLRLMFESEYQILEVDGGEACIRMAREYGQRIVLVLLDLHMPGVNGLDVLRLRSQGEILENTPVIVITVNDDAQSQVEALRLGAADYIVKPFIKEVTEYRVHNAIQMSQMMRRIELERMSYQRKSERDLLTGLYNKLAAETRINEILTREPNGNHVLCIMDLDDFKQVNDTYGHAKGDECIRRYGDFISSFFRSSDIVGRFGGDEFIAFMPDVRDRTVVLRKMEQLFVMLKERERGLDTGTTLSVGVAYSEGAAMTYSELFTNADKALYQAKQRGKSCCVEFSK